MKNKKKKELPKTKCLNNKWVVAGWGEEGGEE